MKYSDEELIRLVILNPGFGIDRFLKVIYPGSDADKRGRNRYYLTQLLIEYKEEYDDDLYELIQSTEYSTTVTEAEYLRITGKNSLPRGRGRGTGSRLSRAQGGGYHNFIELSPQNFQWGEILPVQERTEHSNFDNEKFRLRMYSNIKLRNFRKMWEAYQLVLPIESPTLVSKYLDGDSPNAVNKWVPKMLEYSDNNILEEWFEVIETLRVIEKNNHFLDKEIMIVFRGTFEEYVKDPINNEKPSKEDIFWVFNQLMDEFDR